jgi:hypothetical protein
MKKLKKFVFSVTVHFEVSTLDVNESLANFQDLPVGCLIDSDKDIKITRLGLKSE